MITVFRDDGTADLKRTRNTPVFWSKTGRRDRGHGEHGEFIALTDDERPRVVEAVVDEVAGSIRVYVGADHYSTARTLDHVRHAERSGATVHDH